MQKSYCTQNNGDCFTCSLVNYGLDCANNPINTGSRKGTKGDRALAVYDGHKGPQTINHTKQLIGDDLAKQLTGHQLGLVMSAVNRAYHEGKASTGAEMIDDNAVFITKLGRAIEWEEEGAEYAPVTEIVESPNSPPFKVTKSVKTKDGILIVRFTDSGTETLTSSEAAHIWGKHPDHIKKLCQQGKVEARKSAGTWLVTLAGMERLYGPRPDSREKEE